MTLIAQLPWAGVQFLLSDVLVSSKRSRDAEIVLPTRARIPQDIRNGVVYVPTSFARKIVEIGPKIYAACAGNYAGIRDFAFGLLEYFGDKMFSPPAMEAFVARFFEGRTVDFSAIVLASFGSGHAVCRVGGILERESPSCGTYYVGGSGADYFAKIMAYKNDSGAASLETCRQDILSICAHLLSRELYIGDTFGQNFGGAFEVVYLLQGGFEKIDNIQHVFVSVDDSTDKMDVQISPYIVKQWYHGDCLKILSTVPVEDGQANVRCYVVPSVFTENLPRADIDDMPVMPDWVCLHHQFVLQGKEQSHVMVLAGESLKAINMTREGMFLHMEMTPRYRQYLSDLIRLLSRRSERGQSAAPL